MKAIGYIRVSTQHQANEGASLDAQKAKIESWCNANGAELVEVFVDAGISGKGMKRRVGLRNALESIKRERGMALVVYSLSRMARSTKDTIYIAEQLEKAGADLVSLSERIDTTGAAGKMMFRMLAVLAEFESDVISERVTEVIGFKKSKGEVYGTTPFGFKAVEKRLVVVESEARVVAQIQQQRKAGKTLVQIADALNAKGIQGKQGGKWYASTVRYVLNRKAPKVAA